MAAKPKAAQKVRIDYNVSKEVYDDFVRLVSKKGFVPTVIVERLMKQYIENGGRL